MSYVEAPLPFLPRQPYPIMNRFLTSEKREMERATSGDAKDPLDSSTGWML